MLFPGKKKEKCYLYVLRAGNTDYYKIGSSINVKKRLQSLQGGNPHKLTIYTQLYIRDRHFETQFHKKYAKYRVQGEWFRFNRNVIKTINFESYRNTLHTKLSQYKRKRNQIKRTPDWKWQKEAELRKAFSKWIDPASLF